MTTTRHRSSIEPAELGLRGAGFATELDVTVDEWRMVSPRSLATPADVPTTAEEIARETGPRLVTSDHSHAVVQGVDFVYTDV